MFMRLVKATLDLEAQYEIRRHHSRGLCSIIVAKVTGLWLARPLRCSLWGRHHWRVPELQPLANITGCT